MCRQFCQAASTVWASGANQVNTNYRQPDNSEAADSYRYHRRMPNYHAQRKDNEARHRDAKNYPHLPIISLSCRQLQRSRSFSKIHPYA
jgi:hypothetical protein